jgi:hypothetical protein
MPTTNTPNKPSFVNLKRLLPGMKAAITVACPEGVHVFMVEYDYMAEAPTGNSATSNALLTELPYNSVVKLETKAVIAHDAIEVGKVWPVKGVDEPYEVLAIEMR